MSKRGTSPSAQRFDAYFSGVKQAIEGSDLFEDVRVQLDPFALDDVMKENFKTPACRIFILKMDPNPQASSAQHVAVTLGLLCIAKREGRPDLTLASADLTASGLMFDLAALIQADPYFGLTQLTAAKIEGYRPAVSEKSNTSGLAMTLVQVSSTLLDLIPVWPGAASIFDATRSNDTGLTINDAPVELTP
jgi:hypothetical protein